MKKKKETPRRLAIKNSTFRFSDLYYIGTLIFSIYAVDSIGFSIFTLILLLGTIFSVWKVIKRLIDNKEQIVIDENGIRLNFEDNELIEWKDVKFAYIKITVESSRKHHRNIYWFHIDTKNREFTIKMNDFSFNESLLIECINFHSGRNIGSIKAKLTEKASIFFKNKSDADKAYHIFNTYYKRQINLSIIIMFTLLSIAIYGQIIIDFPYVFAIGWTVTIIVLLILGLYEDKKLRNHDSFFELDDISFKKVINEFGKEFDYSIKNNVLYIIILGVSAIIVFMISHFYSIQ